MECVRALKGDSMIQVGQTVYVRRVGNAARHRTPEEIISEEIVERVGKKYFYLKGFDHEKFGIEEKRDISEYSSNFIVYESKKEIEEEEEYLTKLKMIREVFHQYGHCSLPLEVIRQIFDIIKEELA